MIGAYRLSMIEKFCNLWAEPAKYRCIPTCGTVSKGEAVMNSGIALEAAQRFIGLSSELGRLITSRGNHVQIIRPEIVAFPVKQYEWQEVVPKIVKQSIQELLELVGDNRTLLPRSGVSPCPERTPATDWRFLDKHNTAWQEIENILLSLPDTIIVVT